MNDLFITLKEYCVLSKTVITNSICDSLPGFTFQKVYILISLRTTERQLYRAFKKFMILVITWRYNRNSTTIVSVFLLLTYIFKLFIWRLFYLIFRFVVLFYYVIYLLLDVRRPTASYEIILVPLSVCPSIRPPVCPSITNFSQDWIVRFSWYCTRW